MKMKNNKFLTLAICAILGLTSACSDKDDVPVIEEETPTESRWITVSGALMGTNSGDGDGGTRVYSVKLEDAKDPNKSVDVYNNGFRVKSQRTARLQSSEDGSMLFNIAYTGPDGGEFSKYRVEGGNQYTELDDKVNISTYATASPRWVKLFDGDKTGVAVNLSQVQVHTNEAGEYAYSRGLATVLSLDLQNVGIKTYEQFQIQLTPEEESQGFYVGRLDGPVLNKTQDKLIIGVSRSKHDPLTGAADRSDYEKISSKSLVVDYPTLKNPKLISSTQGKGNTNGYRTFNSFLSDDGNIYQATQNDVGGSKFLKINSQNEYDDSYVLNLDQALNKTNTYVDAWVYAGDGIAIVAYSLVVDGSREGGYLARVNLYNKSAETLNIPQDPDLSFSQYQGFVVHEDEVFVAVTPVGKDGNIYIINSKTGEVTKGAKLINQAGNHYIGIF